MEKNERNKEKEQPISQGLSHFRFITHRGKPALIKDFAFCSRLFRNTCGRYMVFREKAAYRRLDGVRGVPAFLGTVGPDGIIVEWIEGQNCLQYRGKTLRQSFFLRLHHLLAQIRAQGVLHGDIKRNVMVSPGGDPFLVDFGASFVIPWWLRPFRQTIVRIGSQYDECAVAKLKKIVAPELVTVREEELLMHRMPLEDAVRTVERLIHRLTGLVVRLEKPRCFE